MAPDTQRSDHFPITICMDDDRPIPPKHDFSAVCWEYYRTLFWENVKPIEENIAANLHATAIHLFLPVAFSALDMKYAVFATRHLAQRHYRRSRRRVNEHCSIAQVLPFVAMRIICVVRVAATFAMSHSVISLYTKFGECPVFSRVTKVLPVPLPVWLWRFERRYRKQQRYL